MKLSKCIPPANVELDLSVSSKERLLENLSQKASRKVGIDKSSIVAALQKREELGSTGIGAGIAIPHASITGLTSPIGWFARLAKPIEFDSIDGLPVNIVCLVLTPPKSGTAHLTVLSKIARLLQSPDNVRKIRAAVTAEELYLTITGEANGDGEPL
jgi:PTS system nitrogen regulatory IIA component